MGCCSGLGAGVGFDTLRVGCGGAALFRSYECCGADWF